MLFYLNIVLVLIVIFLVFLTKKYSLRTEELKAKIKDGFFEYAAFKDRFPKVENVHYVVYSKNLRMYHVVIFLKKEGKNYFIDIDDGFQFDEDDINSGLWTHWAFCPVCKV